MAGLFIKLDCDYWDHPKVVQAGVMAGVLYLRMSAYCMQHTTDGFVPAAQLPRFALPATARLTAALADVGMIEAADGGWTLPGYVERYPSSAELEQRRQASVENGRKGGRPRNPAKTPGVSSQVPNRLCDTKPSGKQEVEVDVDVEVEPPPPEVTPVPADDGEVVAVADSLIAKLGYATPPPAGPDIRAYTARSLAHGWTVQHLADLATEAGTRDDVGDPLAWFRGALKRCANEDPPRPAPPGDRPGPAPAGAETRDSAWAAVRRHASAGPSAWTTENGLSERARMAALRVRGTIKSDTEANAKWAFFAAWDELAQPAEATA